METERKTKRMCQCPKRAILISTLCQERLSFAGVWCQCPKRAILISTENALTMFNRIMCVNALNGLFSFLLESWVEACRNMQRVSMP